MNSIFKRFRLVDDEEYERKKLKQFQDYNPELDKQIKSEINIEQILNNSKLTSEQKLKLISNLQYSLKPIIRPMPPIIIQNQQSDQEVDLFPYLKKEFPILKSQPLAEEIKPDAIEIKPIFKEFLDELPERFRDKASKLEAHVSDFPKFISKSLNNEVILEGNLVKGSNLRDLLQYLYNPRSKSKSPPIGFTKLVNILATIKTPPNFISNKVIASMLAENLQSGKGKTKSIIIAYAPRFKKSTPSKRYKSLSSSNSFKLYNI